MSIERPDVASYQLISRAFAPKETDAPQYRLAAAQGLAYREQQSSELTPVAELARQDQRDQVQGGARRRAVELEQAQRTGDLARAGELQYGRIPGLEKRLAEAEGQSANALLRERVTEDDIASVVSRWTGIPMDRMLAGERDKLLAMESIIGKRVIGQAQAIEAVSKAVRRARAGLQDPTGRLAHSCFSAPPSSSRPSDQGARRLPVRRRRRHGPHRHERVHGKHAVSRLIARLPVTSATTRRGADRGGAPPAYQVVLFDEVEKAHPYVLQHPSPGARRRRLTVGRGGWSISPTR